jgi:hypothetical protein
MNALGLLLAYSSDSENDDPQSSIHTTRTPSSTMSSSSPAVAAIPVSSTQSKRSKRGRVWDGTHDMGHDHASPRKRTHAHAHAEHKNETITEEHHEFSSVLHPSSSSMSALSSRPFLNITRASCGSGAVSLATHDQPHHHQGRVRAFDHVVGQWPVHIYFNGWYDTFLDVYVPPRVFI